jgi:hypothetical protein
MHKYRQKHPVLRQRLDGAGGAVVEGAISCSPAGIMHRLSVVSHLPSTMEPVALVQAVAGRWC